MKVSELFSILDRLAPLSRAESWDNCGVQVAASRAETGKIAVMLDPVPETVAQGIEWGAKVIVTHHPLYMQPKAPKVLDNYHQVLSMAMGADAWLYAAHTCMDSSAPADWLGQELGLENMEFLETYSQPKTMSVEFWPKTPLARERLEFLADIDGFINLGQDSSGRVRLVCKPEAWNMIRSQGIFGETEEFFVTPFREPAETYGLGRIGNLENEMETDLFLSRLGEIVSRKTWTLSGPEKRTVSRVAYCTGSGASLISAAFSQGADIYVSGDIKYHSALESPGRIVDVGHFCLEEEMMRRFALTLEERCRDAKVRFFPGKDPFTFMSV